MSALADGFTITRTFAAPRELVYAAWTDPAQFASWFGGGAEVPIDRVDMDVRVGGEWKLVMLVGPDKSEMPFFGEFRELDPPARIVMTMKDNTGAGSDRVEIVTASFTEIDGGTEMVFSQRGGNLTPEQYEATEHGWGTFFDQLDADLTAV